MNGPFYVVMSIGCLECHEDSHCLGVFTIEDWAKRVAESQLEFRSPLNRIQMFKVNELNNEYPEYPDGA